MSDPYYDFFLNSKSNVVQYQTIELYHPDWSQTYYIVRNNTAGLTATLEDSSEVTFQYYPMKITENETQQDLDFSIKVQFGDLGTVLPLELDAVGLADNFQTKPTLKYRTYRSDMLTSPMFGPIILEIVSFTFDRESATFDARAPQLNLHKTGEKYTVSRFPMLRGFMK